MSRLWVVHTANGSHIFASLQKVWGFTLKILWCHRLEAKKTNTYLKNRATLKDFCGISFPVKQLQPLNWWHLHFWVFLLWFLAVGKANMGGTVQIRRNIIKWRSFCQWYSLQSGTKIHISALFQSGSKNLCRQETWWECDGSKVWLDTNPHTHTGMFSGSQSVLLTSSSWPSFYCLATSLFRVSHCQHRLVETLEWPSVCLCVCAYLCVINCEVSPRLLPFQCCVQLGTLLGIVFYGLQGLCLALCVPLRCVQVWVSLNSCAQTCPDICNHSFQPSPYLLCIPYMLIFQYLWERWPGLTSPPLPFSSSPLLCRCILCQTSLRSVLRVALGRTQLIAKSQRGSPACRSQTQSMETITTITTIQAQCDISWHLGIEAAACRPQTCVIGSSSGAPGLDCAVNSV